MNYSTREIAEICGGVLYGTGERQVREAVNDHRRLPASGGLFLALAGTRSDGHTFGEAAADAGAAALLVRTDRVHELRHLEARVDLVAVDDVEAALWTLAAWHRARFGGPVVAVTGSVGKTTTKNMLGLILSRTLGRGCFTEGNLNNLLGAPMTVLRMELDDRWLVLELGTNAFGEIPRLAALARPDIAVLTAVAAAHLEGFGDLDGVMREKGALPRALQADGLAIFPADDARIVADSAAWPGRKRPFGKNAVDGVRIVERREGVAASGTLEIHGERFEVTLPVAGAFNIDNAAAAIAAAMALGVTPAAAVAALADYRPATMRMEWREVAGMRFLVDAYNANPDAMKAALGTLVGVPGGRHVAVLGSMLELGARSDALHREVGAAAVSCGADLVVFVGPQAEHYVAGAAQVQDGARSVGVADQAAAAAVLMKECRQGDVVLLKGSRGARLEAVLDRLAEEAK